MRARSRFGHAIVRRGGEVEREAAAAAGFALEGHAAAVRGGDARDEAEAEAAALDLLRDGLAPAVERFEDVAAVFGRDTNPAVFDSDQYDRRPALAARARVSGGGRASIRASIRPVPLPFLVRF